ncbi:MAG: glycosyltransferase family 2 protein [Candidatus Schekmanbacteria bacterium]|nr:glycosyltransferase family 2 protein [Candidatus Schekmanbacteria bacterium]
MTEDKIYLSVVAPAFNEEESIEKVVRYWSRILNENSIKGEIVITDDGSSDRTKEILLKLKEELKNLVIVPHKNNLGYGKALADAIEHSKGEYVVSLDSDGQFDLKEYPSLLNEMERGAFDIVTGFRFKKKDTFLRTFANGGLNFIVKVLMGVKFKDANCAFKLYKGNVIRSINIESKGFPTPTEILVKAKNSGYSIGETGITHHEREGGETKLKALKAIYQITLFLFYLKFKIFLLRAKVINSL